MRWGADDNVTIKMESVTKLAASRSNFSLKENLKKFFEVSFLYSLVKRFFPRLSKAKKKCQPSRNCDTWVVLSVECFSPFFHCPALATGDLLCCKWGEPLNKVDMSSWLGGICSVEEALMMLIVIAQAEAKLMKLQTP